ncbi:Oxalate:formate antiporter [Schistosoma japonicum]|nr:Oxalate:formate antiporter [Schistosoma japonicum]
MFSLTKAANDRMLLFQGCLSVLGGVLLHLTFANMIPYIMDYLRTYVNPNLSDKDAIWLSALGFCTQGFSMPAGGLVAKKLGFRIVVATSCIFLSGSVFATYFTIQKTFIGVVITYSLTMGIGMGFAYSVVFAIATTLFIHILTHRSNSLFQCALNKERFTLISKTPLSEQKPG